MSVIVPVILSGGSGTRLWPASRSMYPKQLLPLTGDRTMLQQTVDRVSGVPGAADQCLVVCNEAHRFLVAEQLRQSALTETILLEPDGRNTAPAVALAALQSIRGGGDPILLVMPADHVIGDNKAFQSAVARAASAAISGKLVTFGIVPTRAETGYGYIRAIANGPEATAVETFVEKTGR